MLIVPSGTLVTMNFMTQLFSLYSLQLARPLKTWNPCSTDTLVSVRWSRTHANLFFACDASSRIFAFDLLRSAVPVPVGKQEIRKACAFDVSYVQCTLVSLISAVEVMEQFQLQSDSTRALICGQ